MIVSLSNKISSFLNSWRRRQLWRTLISLCTIFFVFGQFAIFYERETPEIVEGEYNCANINLTTTRQRDIWDCESPLFPPENTRVLYETREVSSLIRNTPISLLEGFHWGQLCNRLSVFAALLAKLRVENKTNTLIALQPLFSEVAWTLDLSALSSTVPGVLLDCIGCQGRIRYVKCDRLVMKGRVYDVSRRHFKVDHVYGTDSLWYHGRAKIVGYLEEIVTVIQPKPFLKNIVKNIMTRFQNELGPGTVSIAVHRRFMDNLCYNYMGFTRDITCFPSSEAVRVTNEIGSFLESDTKNYYFVPNYLVEMDELKRAKFETTQPTLIACNYTFDRLQLGVLSTLWPKALQSPFGILLSTDSQAPRGDFALRESKFPKIVKQLNDYERIGCFSRRRYHMMFAEMLAMTYADFHMENPISSCGDIVVHWRQSIGKQTGTSFPQYCYDGFYQKRPNEEGVRF